VAEREARFLLLANEVFRSLGLHTDGVGSPRACNRTGIHAADIGFSGDEMRLVVHEPYSDILAKAKKSSYFIQSGPRVFRFNMKKFLHDELDLQLQRDQRLTRAGEKVGIFSVREGKVCLAINNQVYQKVRENRHFGGWWQYVEAGR